MNTVVKQISVDKDGKYVSSQIVSQTRKNSIELSEIVNDFVQFHHGQIALENISTYISVDQSAFDRDLLEMLASENGLFKISMADAPERIYLYQRSIEITDNSGWLLSSQISKPVLTLLHIFETEYLDDTIATYCAAPKIEMMYIGKSKLRIPAACKSTPHTDMLNELRESVHFRRMCLSAEDDVIPQAPPMFD